MEEEARRHRHDTDTSMMTMRSVAMVLQDADRAQASESAHEVSKALGRVTILAAHLRTYSERCRVSQKNCEKECDTQIYWLRVVEH